MTTQKPLGHFYSHNSGTVRDRMIKFGHFFRNFVGYGSVKNLLNIFNSFSNMAAGNRTIKLQLVFFWHLIMYLMYLKNSKAQNECFGFAHGPQQVT